MVVAEVQNNDYIGSGDSSVIRYLKRLFGGGAGYTTTQAIIIGTYLAYSSQNFYRGVGGEIDISIICREGLIRKRQYQDIEQALLRLEAVFARTAIAMFDRRVTEKKFMATLDDLIQITKSEKVAINSGCYPYDMAV